jgi:iron complex transport system substrate-binding protein
MNRDARPRPSAAALSGEVGTTSRRTVLTGAFGLGAALLVASCTNQQNKTPVASTPTGSATATAAAFPVSIEHKFGTTVVPAAPTRVACVGLTEHDTVLALGMKPVAVTEWFGERPYATWSWAQSKLGDAKPEVLTIADGIQVERVAQLAPDLILGTNAGLDEGVYGKLAKIAPTIAQSGKYTDYFEPWKVQAAAIGKALGQDAQMTQLIKGVDDVYAKAQADHPEFKGKNVFLMAPSFVDGRVFVYQEGLSTQFLIDLGLQIPAVVKKYATDDTNAFIPKENLVEALEVADVVIWVTTSDDDKKALLDDPIVARLRATKENRHIFTGLELGAAMNFTTVLSLPFVAEQFVPQLTTILSA